MRKISRHCGLLWSDQRIRCAGVNSILAHPESARKTHAAPREESAGSIHQEENKNGSQSQGLWEARKRRTTQWQSNIAGEANTSTTTATQKLLKTPDLQLFIHKNPRRLEALHVVAEYSYWHTSSEPRKKKRSLSVCLCLCPELWYCSPPCLSDEIHRASKYDSPLAMKSVCKQ